MVKKSKIMQKLLDAIFELELSKEEALATVSEFINRYKLEMADCFPKENAAFVDFAKQVKEQIMPAYVSLKQLAEFCEVDTSALLSTAPIIKDEEEVKDKGETEAPESSPATPQKGYSKNGKKLGRPKKVVVKVEKAEEVESEPVGEIVAPQPTVQIEEKPDEPETEPEKSFEEEVEALKFGKEYSLYALYMYKDRFVRTNRVLTEARAIGVFIPYLRRDGNKEFILYYTDEYPGLTKRVALAYARNKLPAYNGVKWKIKENIHDASIKAVLPELNMLLKKMGGDKFEGHYQDPHETYFGENSMTDKKIRYVCEVAES
ncbi:MAG: hypothetical protein J6K16_07080 [Alphaproteobacteria bacterium]|nr:hypothetical protein [Alphaproteobacteria bacterium]